MLLLETAFTEGFDGRYDASRGKNKFEKCFQPVPEKFRGKETGNQILNDGCKFCSYRFDCWPTLTERPAVMSQAKNPPTASYIGDVIAA